MDLATVKTCFEKYVTYVEINEKVNCPEKFDINTISIQEMDKITQLMFMDYAIKCGDKINQFSITCTLYKHVNSLIRQYMQDESNKVNAQLQDMIHKLQDNKETQEKVHEPIQLTPISQPKSRGWFF
ncbi:hypothetical protein QKU48_gp1278 [Fadolivirus algeromassiliense]|jgi:uncharacterized protein YcbK (DUF882 family)|uniref:Uncharacterized protein n=1 Tax=Fadolivirus FV1/VV64 TaxID=3070911 RepID=A0A7D3V7Z3_9VIRU|nr:hypothetical protein QKU48_gp1278 [Fadolivirus algeromassiliense]QKF94736.1 hypothetical protein Fadolivirus_1_1278 [Fadolivirus FV1/VV64]